MDAVGAAGKETGMDNSRNAVSDGKLYNWNDLVKVGCHDCSGCSACCRDMGQSVLLDPMDVFRLERNLGQSFEQLLAGPAELHVEDGLILPNLKMAGEEPRCFFLNEQGRCAIHAFRPGICRLFPLGRDYEEGRLRYFLLTDACPAKNKSKVKVRKWLDMEGLAEYGVVSGPVAWTDEGTAAETDSPGGPGRGGKTPEPVVFTDFLYDSL